jgi:pimeloyl-ACP methyl ester carboxylesterase
MPQAQANGQQLYYEIHGEGQPLPVWKSHELGALIPDAKLSIIERAAHAVNIERAPEFNELVLGFL